MNPRFLLALALAAALIGLHLSDRALRRMEKMDDVVLRGQTGLPWIDDFLSRRAAERAKRAAYEAELRKLLSAVTAASTLEQRIAANYAVAKLESGQGRSGSRHARLGLLAITREGKSRPETVEA